MELEISVEEENGMAKRPIKGLPEYMLDTIQKEMVGYNNMISPPYFHKVFQQTGNRCMSLLPEEDNSAHISHQSI